MASATPTIIPLALSLLIFLFLFTFSHARHATEPEPETEIQTSKTKPHQQDTVSFSVDSADSVPLTLLSLRPIRRHLPPHHQLPLPLPLPSSLRFGHRRCRHGHRREISYGNDAIVHSSGVATVDHLIPARWVRIRHGQPRITEIPRFDRHLDHHNHHHHHRYHGEEEKKKKHDKGWFLKKIRNFFNLF